MEVFDKEKYLKEQFNTYWSSILNKKKDYYSIMTDESFDLLKAALSNINNIITFNTTLKFIDKMSQILKLNDNERNMIIKKVKSTKPSDNGFDIEYSGSKNIVCEVKCNRPINGGNRFGAAQKNGIKKDIDALLNSKSKSVISCEEIKNYYKFMVIYNFDGNTVEAIINLLANIAKEFNNRVKMYEEGESLSKDNVYIVLVK